MIFDTHAHYYDDAFDADRDALLSSLPERGVALVVCPGCDLESSRQSIALAERYPFLYAAAGYREIGRRRGYYRIRGRRIDALVMERTLGAPGGPSA